MVEITELQNAPLGKEVAYSDHYDPSLLFPIPRSLKRQALGITESQPFMGDDVWYSYELSWLNARGKPMAALGKFTYSCATPFLVESKSFKLYLNSFSAAKFATVENVKQVMMKDLSAAINGDVSVDIHLISELPQQGILGHFSGFCLDNLDIECDTYQVHPEYLHASDHIVHEVLYSDLFKSLCLKTGQPDWASVQITYTGGEIDKEGLLKYLVSFRNHQGFHEHCMEQIFMDILQRCQPQKLTLDGRVTRRGGLDIHLLRSTENPVPVRQAVRLWRQ
jgi:7-cyano-7-deazaguanine reductase